MSAQSIQTITTRSITHSFHVGMYNLLFMPAIIPSNFIRIETMFPSNQSSHVKQMNKNEQYNLINILHWGCRCFRWCKWIRWWGIQTIGSSIIHVSLLNSHIWYRQVLSIPHRTSSFATSWFIYELMCTSVWIIHLHLCILSSSNRGNDKCYFTYSLQVLCHAT